MYSSSRQSTCRQAPGMCKRRARAGRNMAREAQRILAHTKGFVDVGLFRRRVAGCVCGNMHNEQGKSCAGELYVDHPGNCRVAQVADGTLSACCPSLSCFTTDGALEMRPTRCILAHRVQRPAHAASKTHTSAKPRATDPLHALAARALVRASRYPRRTPCPLLDIEYFDQLTIRTWPHCSTAQSLAGSPFEFCFF